MKAPITEPTGIAIILLQTEPIRNADGDEGWSLADYDDATFFLAVELAVPLAENVAKGEYPQFYDWSLPETDDNMSYIHLETGEGDTFIEYYSDDSSEDNSPVIVTGGVNGGDKMTLKFSGKLIFYHKEGDSWVEEEVTGKFNFSATVQDERPI